MTGADPNHGSYAAYQYCRNHPDGPCAACREAANAYMRAWRARNQPTGTSAHQRARARALRRLGRLYPADLQRLLHEELEKENDDDG